jgi:chromate reductase
LNIKFVVKKWKINMTSDRPPKEDLFLDNPFDGKPVAIMSASVGMLGGARAQYHLRQMFVFLNMYPVNGPEVIVTFAQDKFDANGKLVDENTRKYLTQLLRRLADWTDLLRH